MEDFLIVQSFLRREECAIRYTTEKYGAQLRRISYGITADAQTAEECENDTYWEAWNRIPPCEPSTYLFAFLARIVRHISLDRCRKRSALKRGAMLIALSEELEYCLPHAAGADAEYDEKALGVYIGKFLSTLNREKRVIFVRRYFYMDSVEAVAKRLAISKSKVKVTLFRIRTELREYLNKEGYTL